MAKSILTLLVTCCLLPFFAYGNYVDSSELPDKPSKVFVKPLLEAFNSADPNKVQAFVTDNFTQEYLKRYPMNAHINYVMDSHARLGNFTVHSSRDYDEQLPEHEMVIIVKADKTEQFRAVSLFVTTEKPHKIKRLAFSPARYPSNLPKPEPLTLKQAVEELDSYAKRMAKRDAFSGSVLLAKGEEVLFKAAYGMASKRFEVANNVETKFNLGSMNKMFTSVAIMQLVEAGKLSLNDKLSKFADDTWLPKDITDKIEIRHLLTHASGLGSYFNSTYRDASKAKFRILDDYKPLVKDETLRFEPGTDNRYSNTGMLMLGVVIEAVSGQDYFSYIQDNIYDRAGMKHSNSYEMDQPVPNLAIGYGPARDNPYGWQNNLYSHVLKGGPAGGGFSTVTDLHRFAMALTQYKLLSEALTEELYSPKPDLHSPNYGYGFGVSGSPENRIVGHRGGFIGISANLDVYLDEGYVSAVLSNYSFGSEAVEMKIQDLLERVE